MGPSRRISIDDTVATSDDSEDERQNHGKDEEMAPPPQVRPPRRRSSSKLLDGLKGSFTLKKQTSCPVLTREDSMFDLDGDGVLDEVEMAMRDHDVDGNGELDKDEIYNIVNSQLTTSKKENRMKKAVAVLLFFVVLLALSNLGTSWAAVVMAKDLSADDNNSGNSNLPVTRIAATGDIAAVQTTADTFEIADLPDEVLEERRRLVLQEMKDDPHSHSHRFLKKTDCNEMYTQGCKSKRLSHDTKVIKREVFDKIEKKCKMQENVYLEHGSSFS